MFYQLSPNLMWNILKPAVHFRISHFAGISWIFSQNTPRNKKHSLYTSRILCEFRVLLMPRKNKAQNPLTFRTNADPAKCKKWKRGTKCEKNWREIPRYTLFVFRISQNIWAFKRNVWEIMRKHQRWENKTWIICWIIYKGIGYKHQKAKLGMRKVHPWKWMPFTNPARKDSAIFYHWRRVADEGKEYPFAQFNKVSITSRT